MLSVTVPPMATDDTCRLAAELLKTTKHPPADIPSMASKVALEVGGFPYSIHHVVDQLDQLQRPTNPTDITSAVDKLVYDAQEPANFNYYVTRLEAYYSDQVRLRALLVLDTMAGHKSPISLATLLNLCKHRDPSLSEEELRDTVNLLLEDHYIEEEKPSNSIVYSFRWPLVKKWWQEKRT